jgi:hypothetical protein
VRQKLGTADGSQAHDGMQDTIFPGYQPNRHLVAMAGLSLRERREREPDTRCANNVDIAFTGIYESDNVCVRLSFCASIEAHRSTSQVERAMEDSTQNRPDVTTGDVPNRDAGRQDGDRGRLVAAFILIALGIFFLVANFAPIGGGALFLALGLAFSVARVMTGSYGLAVPAGVLFGFGSFVVLSEANVLPGEEGGWFFILLGAGFLAVYLIGLRPLVIWPLFPAAALIIFGLLLLGAVTLDPLTDYAWVLTFWPLVLVAIGLWLLIRDSIPATLRRPLQVVGFLALVAYGVLAVLAAMATTGMDARVDLRSGTTAPFNEIHGLSSPIAPGEMLRVINQTGGSTSVRAIEGSDVRVTATKRMWRPDQAIDTALERGNGELVLRILAPSASFGPSPAVDLAVDLPAGSPVDVSARSGRVDLVGLRDSVQVQASSGAVSIDDASASVTVRTSSGSITVANIAGMVNAMSSSGRISGDNLDRIERVTTSSGRITLAGVFSGNTQIQSSSGNVTVRFAPESSARVDVSTSSGSLHARDLGLRDQQEERRRLTGVLGAGEGTVSILTSSGDVTLESWSR